MYASTYHEEGEQEQGAIARATYETKPDRIVWTPTMWADELGWLRP